MNELSSRGFKTKVLIHTALSHGIHCYRALWMLTKKKKPHAVFKKPQTKKKHKSLQKKLFIKQRHALWPWTTTSWQLRAHREKHHCTLALCFYSFLGIYCWPPSQRRSWVTWTFGLTLCNLCPLYSIQTTFIGTILCFYQNTFCSCNTDLLSTLKFM